LHKLSKVAVLLWTWVFAAICPNLCFSIPVTMPTHRKETIKVS